jgi:hypothetical protein
MVFPEQPVIDKEELAVVPPVGRCEGIEKVVRELVEYDRSASSYK